VSVKLICGLIVGIVVNTCLAQNGTLTYLTDMKNDSQVVSIAASIDRPLLIYRGKIFIISSDCIRRTLGGDNNQRQLKNESNDRSLNVDNNNRQVVVESDARKVNTDNNDRSLNTESDGRKLNTDNEQRQQNGESNNRITKSDNNDRNLNVESNDRNANVDNNSRASKSDNNDRNNSVESNDRKLNSEGDNFYCDINSQGELILHFPKNSEINGARVYYNMAFYSSSDNFFIIKTN